MPAGILVQEQDDKDDARRNISFTPDRHLEATSMRRFDDVEQLDFDDGYSQDQEREDELPNQVNKGKGFPVGVSVNNCAAHFTCHNDCNKILKRDDLISIDYGVHYDGYIIDQECENVIDFYKKENELKKVESNIQGSLKRTKEYIELMKLEKRQ